MALDPSVAKVRAFEEIAVGATANSSIKLTAHDVARFAELSGDYSPIHIDVAEATRRGYSGKVAHGALLGAHVSALIGMELPGARGILQSLELQFRQPVCPPCEIRVQLEVTGVTASVRQVRLGIKITDEKGNLCAMGKASSIIQ